MANYEWTIYVAIVVVSLLIGFVLFKISSSVSEVDEGK